MFKITLTTRKHDAGSKSEIKFESRLDKLAEEGFRDANNDDTVSWDGEVLKFKL